MKSLLMSFLLACCAGLWGEERTVLFPGLADDLMGRPAGVRIALPQTPLPGPPPLLIWFGGGRGAADTSEVPALVDRNHWAVAVVPYSGNLPRPLHAMHQGRMQEHWEYHRPMLETLRREFPDSFVVAAGLSNGAHLIASYLAEGREELTQFAEAYAVVEGSCRENVAKGKLPGIPIYLAWGGHEGGSMGLMQNIVDVSREMQMDLTTRTMPNVGHGFPEEEVKHLADWLAGLPKTQSNKLGETDEDGIRIVSRRASADTFWTVLKGHRADVNYHIIDTTFHKETPRMWQLAESFLTNQVSKSNP